ncbi:MAG: hypothetical protein HY514_02410 [Candidatus Aenigmarchaeota archaeon]|nr:hypothetical protein [Candidatus Aenigmarchaeota archaeon]
MKLELKNERLNPHLKRKELEIEIDHENEATPQKAALVELIAEQFGHTIENTDVRGIYTHRGAGKSRAKVFVWAEKKVINEIAGEQKKEESKKGSIETEPKAQTQKTEAAADEKKEGD